MYNTINTIYTQQIQKILQDIHIDLASNKLILRGGEKSYDFVHSPQSNETNLLNTLTECIYSHFYCKGYNTSLTSISENTFDVMKRTAFIDRLSAANTTTEGFDWGWKVENMDDKHNVYAIKGNVKKIISSGEYINEKLGQAASFSPHSSQMHTINYYRRKEMRGEDGGFYYVFSQHVGEDNAQSSVRVYFNIESEGASTLVKLITDTFNQCKVPFQFKCLNDPSTYLTRTDTAVLYLDKQSFNFSMELLYRAFRSIAPYLKSDVPLFTCPLSINGISFAESPPNPEDSFGLNRSRLIALGLINSINKQLPPQMYMNEILLKIEQVGLNISAFYLNPKSSYPYKIV